MRIATIGVTTLFIGGLFCLPARADFAGLLVVREFVSQQTNAGIRDVFHVYAEFTNPIDRVTAWFGTAADPLLIENRAADGTSLGTGFTNFGNGTLAPEIDGTPQDWDTFATIGLRFGSEGIDGVDRTVASPVFPPFIVGNYLISASAGVSVEQQYDLQGSGGWRVVGNDTALRVLLMQLTVMPGEQMQGTLNVTMRIVQPGSQLRTPFRMSESHALL